MPAGRFEACERLRLTPRETCRCMLRKRSKQLTRSRMYVVPSCRGRIGDYNPLRLDWLCIWNSRPRLRANLGRVDASASCARSKCRYRF
jgi:hypothetical protein